MTTAYGRPTRSSSSSIPPSPFITIPMLVCRGLAVVYQFEKYCFQSQTIKAKFEREKLQRGRGGTPQLD
jgi:hypothetical protein